MENRYHLEGHQLERATADMATHKPLWYFLTHPYIFLTKKQDDSYFLVLCFFHLVMYHEYQSSWSAC